ncbi:hypothetical protein PGT21_034076 [Puccinia graminis f. sp. tritici]|uniref:Uncharacterized protein n=1 Tax=Puccinia graminis f. sp. tritici TaxID=56615 RepID=A0A5B0PJZ2_PUCGR|nr:hypothetical protein PGT21_034076 [Puccinia graminis f. sp. tritici]
MVGKFFVYGTRYSPPVWPRAARLPGVSVTAVETGVVASGTPRESRRLEPGDFQLKAENWDDILISDYCIRITQKSNK